MEEQKHLLDSFIDQLITTNNEEFSRRMECIKANNFGPCRQSQMFEDFLRERNMTNTKIDQLTIVLQKALDDGKIIFKRKPGGEILYKKVSDVTNSSLPDKPSIFDFLRDINKMEINVSEKEEVGSMGSNWIDNDFLNINKEGGISW